MTDHFNAVRGTVTDGGAGNLTVSATGAGKGRPLSVIPVGTSIGLRFDDANGVDWELSRCTMLTATTLSRDTLVASSTGSKISLSAGSTALQTAFAEDFNAMMSTADIPFSASIPLTRIGTSYMAAKTISAALTLTPAASAVRGARVYLRLIADGSHAPDYSAFKQKAGSQSFNNAAGVENQLEFFYDGANYFATVGQAVGVAVAATALTMSGPSTGVVGLVSSNYSVALSPAGSTATSVTVTPSDSSGSGTFSPTSLTLTTAAPSGSFTYIPASAGAKSISISNNGGLTNPSALTYTATAPAGQAPTIVSAPSFNVTPQVAVPVSITAGVSSGATSTVRSIYVAGILVAGPAAGAGYTPVNADGGKQFSVTEVATNATGSTPNPSANSAACLPKTYAFAEPNTVGQSTERILPNDPDALYRIVKNSSPFPITIFPSGNLNYQNNRPTTGGVLCAAGGESLISDGGSYYATTRKVSITALSYASGVATATAVAHGLNVGDAITVVGGATSGTASLYNSLEAIVPTVLSVPDADTFTYTPGGVPTSVPTTMPTVGPFSPITTERFLP